MAVEALQQALFDAETRAYVLVVLTFLAGVALQFLVQFLGLDVTTARWWYHWNQSSAFVRLAPSRSHGKHGTSITGQGCILYHNWWPLLTAFAYVLVPMPYLFFADADPGGSWVDASKFLTGAAVVGTIAVPSVLYAAHMISSGALYLEVMAVLLMGSSLVAYDQLSEETNAGGFYSAL